MSEKTNLTQSKPEDFLSDENLKNIVEIVDKEYSNKRDKIYMESISVRSKTKYLDNIVTLHTSVIMALIILMIPAFFETNDKFGFIQLYITVLIPVLSIAYILYSLIIKRQKQCIQQADKTLSIIGRMKLNQDIEMHKKSLIEKISFSLLIVSIVVLITSNSTILLDVELNQLLDTILRFLLMLVPIFLYIMYIAKLLDMKSFYEILEIVISDNITNGTFLNTKNEKSSSGKKCNEEFENIEDELADLSIEESGELKLKVNKNIASMPNTESQSQVEIIYSDAKAYKINIINNIKTLE